MLYGHREAQIMFQQLGKELGFHAKRSYSQGLPTDGVWFQSSHFPLIDKLPQVALEVVVSESPKRMRGSVATIEQVSPALGALLIQEDEIYRRLLRTNKTASQAGEEVARLRSLGEQLVQLSKQRLVVWSMSQLRAWFKLYTGKSSVHEHFDRGENHHGNT